MGLRAFVVNFHTPVTTFVRIDNPAPAPIVGAVPTKAEHFYYSAPTYEYYQGAIDVR